MPRNAPAMTVDSLKALLLDESLKMPDLDDEYFEQAQNDDDYESLITAMFHEGGLSKARDDWAKINFDYENVMLNGFYVTDGGTPYALMYVGGDWESPIGAALYFDGKALRGYVPKDGNYYNHKTKSAFGNGEEGEDDAEALRVYAAELFGKTGYYGLEADEGKLRADINKRISTVGSLDYVSGQRVAPRVTKAAAHAAAEAAAGVDLSGDITSDMVYVRLSRSADGCYFQLILRASGRELTPEECTRVVGIPANYEHVIGSSGYHIWYSNRGVVRTAEIIQSQGWAVDPEQAALLEHDSDPKTVIYYI